MATYKVGGPFLGLNKTRDPGFLLPGESQDTLNVSLKNGLVEKRPGWSSVLDFNGDPILGGADYLRVNTSTGAVDVINLIKASSNLYKIQEGTGEVLYQLMSGTGLMSVCIVNNKAYFCDGSVFKVTDATSSSAVYDAAITRPDAPSVAATVGSGPLRGDYDYKVTYYASGWGQESASSDASGTVSPDGKGVTVTLPDASPDLRVTNRRIYRRNISSLESDWFFVADADNIQGTTSYTDTKPEADVNKARRAPLSYDSTMPAFRYLAYQADVLFAAGADKEPTRLYYSRPSEPWALDQYLEVGSAADTDPITGLTAYQGQIVVWKERSIWILSGNDDATFYLRKIIPGLGCKSGHSVVEMGNMLAFLSEDDFFVFDGTSVASLGKTDSQSPVGPVIRARNYARDRYCVGAYDAEEGILAWTFSTSSSAVNDATLVFFQDHAKSVGYPSWCLWTWGEDNMAWLGRLTDYSTRDRRMHLGTAGGVLGKIGGPSDAGASIQWYWHTGDFDGRQSGNIKEWGEIALDFNVEPVSTSVNVECFLDGSTSPVTLGTHDLGTPTFRRRIRRSSRTISFRVGGSTAAPAAFNGLEMTYERRKRT
jgi:hypothetical protein